MITETWQIIIVSLAALLGSFLGPILYVWVDNKVNKRRK